MNNYLFYNDEDDKNNKIMLKNIDDLKKYVYNALETFFDANIKNNIVEFNDDKSKVKFSIKKQPQNHVTVNK